MAVSFKISKLGKYTLIVSLTLLLAAELVDSNLPETAALWWHLGHGFKAQCCGVQLRVPLRYWVIDDPRSLLLFGGIGYIRWKLFRSAISGIHLYAQDGNQDQARTRKATEILIASYELSGNKLVGSKTIQVGGVSLECTELYIDHFDVFGSQNTVFCFGNGLSISFEGSPALLNEFYSIVQGAEATGRRAITNTQ